MFKLLSGTLSLLLVLVSITLLGSPNLSAAHRREAVSRIVAGQNLNWQPVDLSGSYKGRVLFADRAGHLLIRGRVVLKIDERGARFALTDDAGTQLTDGAGRQLKGQISTSLIPENLLGVGWIQLDTEPERIEIRWNNDRRVLKLLRATGANRRFRFCSRLLRRAECLDERMRPNSPV